MNLIWVPHYLGDYAKETMFLSLEAHGAYRLIADVYFSTGGPVPSDRFKIAKILRVSPQKTKKILEEISPFFEERDGFLVNKRIDIELDKLLKKHETAKANGRAGGRASAKAKAVPSHIHSQNNNKRESRKINHDFYPNEETQEYLRFRNIEFDQNNIDSFIQYYISKGNQCSNWQAKFKQWMLKEKTFSTSEGGNNETRIKPGKQLVAEAAQKAGVWPGGGS